MPDGRDKLKKLHQNLVTQGYDLPDYAQFEVDMADSNKLSRLHQNLVKEGYDLPDWNTFRTDMGYGVKKKSAWDWQEGSGAGSVVGGLTGGKTGQSENVLEGVGKTITTKPIPQLPYEEQQNLPTSERVKGYKLKKLQEHSLKPIAPELLTPESQIKISDAIVGANMRAEQGEEIPTSEIKAKDELAVKHGIKGLNYLKEFETGKYNAIMRAIREKGSISDADYETIMSAGQYMNNLSGETQTDNKYESFQTKKAKYAGQIGEFLKKNLPEIARPSEYSEPMIREAAKQLGLKNEAVIKDLVFQEDLFGKDAIPKGGGAEAFIRGVKQPFQGIMQTLGNINKSSSEIYLESKDLDRFDQLVPNEHGRLSTTLPSERKSLWIGAMEGLGQFLPQVALTKGIGGAALKGTRAANIALKNPTRFVNISGTLPSIYLQEYGNAYEDALAKTGNPQLAKKMGFINAGAAALFELMLPDAKLADKAADIMKKGYASKILKVINDGGDLSTIAKKGRPLLAQYGKEVAKIVPIEIAEEVGTNIVNYLDELIFSPQTVKDRDLLNETGEIIKSTAIQMSIPALLGAGGSLKNNFTLETINDAALNLDEYRDALDKSNVSEEDKNKIVTFLEKHRQNLESTDPNLPIEERKEQALAQTKQDIQPPSAIEKAVVEGRVKGMYAEMVNQGQGEEVLQDIAKQAQNLDQDGKIIPDGKDDLALQATIDIFGEDVVKEAIEKYPYHDQNLQEEFAADEVGEGEVGQRVKGEVQPDEISKPIELSPEITTPKEQTASTGLSRGDVEGDYRGQHILAENKTTADKLTEGGTGFDWEHVATDHDLSDKATRESYRILKSIKDNPDAEVTIYRSVPKGVDKINEGDWVTLSPTYAKEHGMHESDPSQDLPVISMKVKAKDIIWDGNDLNEFAYKPQSLSSTPPSKTGEVTTKEQAPDTVTKVGVRGDFAVSGKGVTLPTNEGKAANTTLEAKGTYSEEGRKAIENNKQLPKQKEKKLTQRVSEIDIDGIRDPYDRVLHYFATRGKIHSSAIQQIFGAKGRFPKQVEGEKRSRIGMLGKNAPTIDQLSHKIWEDMGYPDDITTQDIRDAVESVIISNNNWAGAAKELTSKYDYDALYEKYMETKDGQETIEIAEKLTDEEINYILELDAQKGKEKELDDYIESLQNQAIPLQNKENIRVKPDEIKEPPPPKEPPVEPIAGGEEEGLSGIKKSLVSDEIVKGVDMERLSDEEMMGMGRKILETGEVKPRELVEKIITEKHGVLTPAEVVGLIYYKADLDNRQREIYSEINKRKEAGEDLGTLSVEAKNIERDISDYEVMSVITAQQQSLAFRLRKKMLDRQYNVVTQIEKYKADNDGYIPPEVESKFKELGEKYDEVKRKLAEAEQKLQDQSGAETIGNIKEAADRERAVEERVKEGIQKEIDAIYQQLPKEKKSLADKAIQALENIQKKLRGKSYSDVTGMVAIVDAGITTIKNAIKAGVAIVDAVEIGIKKIRDLMAKKGITEFKEDEFRKDMVEGFDAEGVSTKKGEIALNEDGSLNIPEKKLKEIVGSGITDIGELTDKVYEDAVKIKPDATKREVRDAITDYGKKINPTKDQVQLQLNTAKRIGRLLSEVEDLQNKKSKEKNPSTAAKLTAKERELKRQIRALEKDAGIDHKRSLTEEEKLSSAKERVRNRISELERRIRNKDFSNKSKLPQQKDSELIRLEAEKERLEEQFDNEQYKLKLKNRTPWQKAEDIALEITSGVVRGLVASFDLSASFVQGLYRMFVDFGKSGFQLLQGKKPTPNRTINAFGVMFRHLVSQKASEEYLSKVKSSEAYPLMKASKLAIDDKSGHISAKEGFFISNWVNLIWNHAIAPAVSLPIAIGTKGNVRKAYDIAKAINPYLASQRAFDGYINAIRVNTFSDMAKSIQNDGYNFESNPEVFNKAADFVNTTTGRGSLGAADASSRWLNIFLFAPRKVVSEVKLFTPYAFAYYAKLPKPVRTRALQNLATFLTTFVGTNALLWAASKPDKDDDEGMKMWLDFWNPSSSNFLTHKLGNKRISIGGGAKSMITFQSRLISGDFVDQYGIKSKLGDRFGKQINTRFDLITNFIAGKSSPIFNVGIKKLQERKNLEVDEADMIKNLTVPIWLQDLKELYKKDPATVNAIITILSVFGANVRAIDGNKNSPFTDEDKKDPTFKYFIDRGMELPNVVPASVEVHDSETKTIKNLTDYPEEKIKEYGDVHKGYLKENLKKVIDRGYVYEDDYGSISTDKDKGYHKISIQDLSKEQLAKVLKSAQVKATNKTKNKLFPKNSPKP